MKPEFITLNNENIEKEHICCAFSDKKCSTGYELKKNWLKKEFENGYVFRRLNERGKVFIEYVPAEKAWVPIEAPNYLMINCFWVSGQYKQHGYGKALLNSAIEDAKRDGKSGLVTVAGTKKFHFMSDTKWLIRQGFEVVQTLPYGFSLLVFKLDTKATNPQFKDTVLSGKCPHKTGLVAYYTNRCPFTEYHIQNSLIETARLKNIPLKIIKLKSMEEAQAGPTPATIFTLFYNSEFVTTDLSVCIDKRMDKVLPALS